MLTYTKIEIELCDNAIVSGSRNFRKEGSGLWYVQFLKFSQDLLTLKKEHFNHLRLYEMLTREIQYKTNVFGLNDAKFQVKTRYQSML